MKKIVASLGILLSLVSAAAWADSTISNLQSGSTIQTNDLVPIVRPGTPNQNLKVTVGSAATVNIGTSGATVPVLSGSNTWSGQQVFLSGDLSAADPVFTGGSLLLPSGITSARPSSPANGMIRYTITNTGLEAYINNTWVMLGSSAGSSGSLQVAGSVPGSLAAYSGITCGTNQWLNAIDVTGASSSDCVQPTWTSIGSKPTTLSGFGITNGLTNTATITAAGPIGAAATVPVITFNSTGQLTAVTTVPVTPSAIGAPTTSGTGASGTWPISVSGNAGTSTALASIPTQCSAGLFSTGVAASGNANCSAPSGSGYVAGPGTSTSGFVPLWSGTSGIALGTGLPVGTTGSNTVVETSAGGQIAASIVPTLNQNTTGNAATASALSPGSTINGVTYTGGSNITIPAAAATLTGNTLASGVTSSSLTSFGAGIALGTPASGVLTNETGLPLTTGVTGVLPQANGGDASIPVAKYGATGASSDDCPAIQSAINAAAAQGSGTINSITGAVGGTVSFTNTIYKCATPLTFDPGTVGFEWNGAIIDATGMTTGPVFNVTQTAGGSSGGMLAGLQQARKNKFHNVCFVGPGLSSSVDLFVFNTTASSSFNSSRMSFDHICAIGFRRGESYQNGAYLIHGSDIEYNLMADCFYMGSGFSSYGEAISHDGGGCYSSSVGVYSGSGSGTNTQNFSHFSFDFDGQVLDDEAGLVTFDTTHVEAQGGALTQPLFKVANTTGAVFRWHGGEFLLDTGSGSGPYSGTAALFDTEGTSTAGGNMIIDDLFTHNLNLASGALCTGTGRIKFTNITSYDSETGPNKVCPITNTYANYMVDGGFASSTIKDFWTITKDTAAITNRTTGTNITLAIDTTAANCAAATGSTHALAVHKIGAAGTAAAFSIFYPVPPNSVILQDFFVSAPGTPTGSFTIQNYFDNVQLSSSAGVPVVGSQTAINSVVTETLSGTALPYTEYAKTQVTKLTSPTSANYIQDEIDLTSAPAGYYCVGTVVMSTL